MSTFPNTIDNDFTLPPVNNNITEIGSDAINSLREAVFNIENEIGASSDPTLKASGTCLSIAERLNVSLEPNGNIKPSAFLYLSQIYDNNVANNAGIQESKLDLFCGTEVLFNNYLAVSSVAETASNWIFTEGNKLQNHISGTDPITGQFNHFLTQIHIANSEKLKNRFTTLNPTDPSSNGDSFRSSVSLFNLLNDINSDYVIHQKSDGYKLNQSTYIVKTLSGKNYPSNFAHTAAGVHLNTSNYTVFPTTIDNVQSFADYIDQNNDLLAGKRPYNLFSTGISRTSRSSSMLLDGYGPSVLPPNRATTYLLQGSTSIVTPQDNPTNGDDIIKFRPPTDAEQLKTFNNNFSLIKIGDIVRVNYGYVTGFGVVESQFLVKEKKYIPSNGAGSPNYSIRIDGKNLLHTTTATVRVDRSLLNVNKGGVLSVSAAQCLDNDGNNITNFIPSLIVNQPRGAVTIGSGFDASQINKTNYYLYLILYPDGNLNNKVEMKAIDITGNKGTTPGKYTLEYIVNATNNAFRKKGFNHRFSAFSYNGNFGVMLSDPYNNASFSIVAGELRDHQYTQDSGDGNHSRPFNIIQYDSSGNVTTDPLGFGKGKGNIASPYYYNNVFDKEDAFNHPVKIFTTLRRNNYYVDGVGIESDKLAKEPTQFEDGYWLAEVVSYNDGSFTYKINKDLKSSGLAVGKTIVVQPSSSTGDNINFGRFIISNIQFNICEGAEDQTFITVLNGIHDTGIATPPSTLPINSLSAGSECKIYFCEDSVGLNLQHSSGNSSSTSFKRYFEVYVDKQGKTFSLERARFNISSNNITLEDDTILNYDNNLSQINLVKVSSKLRGHTGSQRFWFKVSRLRRQR